MIDLEVKEVIEEREVLVEYHDKEDFLLLNEN
jgi:hypothetical protein